MQVKILNEELRKILESIEKTFADYFGTNLTGKSYDGDIRCINKGLTSLHGTPETVSGSFECQNNELESLQFGPKYAHSYYCQNNQLEDLSGAPQEVAGYFNCSNNPLKSFKGLPKKIKTLVAEGLDYSQLDLSILKQSQIDNIIPKTLKAIVNEVGIDSIIKTMIDSVNKGYKKYATNRKNKGANFDVPEQVLGYYSLQNLNYQSKQYKGKLVSSNLDAKVLESITKSINERFNPFALEIESNIFVISW